jgi:hypothetical protein
MATLGNRIFVPITGDTLFRHSASNEVHPLKDWLTYAKPLGEVAGRALVEGFVASGMLVRCVAEVGMKTAA